MALTRSQIKSAVDSNTGRGTEKASLIERLCDEALKVAVSKHPFRDAQSRPTAVAITENATSVDISTAITSTLVHIVTARICEVSGSSNTKLIMKDPVWWDANVVESADNMKGWPVYGLRSGTTILFDRPAESNLAIKLALTQEKTFAADATVCPVTLLDLFVVQYVTAMVFLSVEQESQYAFWKSLALGPQWDAGVVGGTLKHAIDTDKFDLSEEMLFEQPGGTQQSGGLSVLNLDSYTVTTGKVDCGTKDALFNC